MTFNTALSGLSAATADLRATGNNIANAGTVGYKAARAEFSDVYASSLLGSGANQIGSGVKLASVAQQFDQGTISFTNNSLDLAIDGNGFFVVSDNGARGYTRAGMFGVDEQGFLVANNGSRVQGFTANSSGSVSGVLGDLQVQTSNLAPRLTTLVDASLNLDARQPVLSQIGSTISSQGAAVGLAKPGILTAVPTQLTTAGVPTPFDYGVNTASTISANNGVNSFDFSQPNASASFDISLSGSSIPAENQTVTINLNTNVNSLQDIISDIRGELSASGIGVDVREDPNAFGRLQFFATNSGEDSTITIDPTDSATLGSAVTVADVEAVLGGISLGQGGAAGSSNIVPDPFGTGGAGGNIGNLTAASFDVVLAGASANNGTVRINLTSNIQTVADLISDIRNELVASSVAVDVREDPNAPGQLQFVSTAAGEASTVTVTNLDTSNIGVTSADLVATLNLATGVSTPGVPGVNNGYAAQTVDVVDGDGNIQSVTTTPNASAAQTAAQFSSTSIPGITATASTTATIPAAGFTNGSGTLSLSLNGVALSGTTVSEIANSINATSGLGTITAGINSNGDLVVDDQVGNDLVFGFSGAGVDTVSIVGGQGNPVTLSVGGNTAASVGGTIDFTLDEGYVLSNASPANSNIFGVLDPSAFTQFELNTFEPSNQDTYNAATSVTIFDSLGNPHVMTTYYVKERFNPNVPGQEENRWSVYVQIDGRDVGDPNPNLTPPANTEPSRARYQLQFNPDGTQNPAGSDPILVSNWVPLDENGQPNGALGPQNTLSGGALPVPEPPASSNFEIRLSDSTQFGSDFSVADVQQNGFTTGQLSGLDIDDEGLMLSRYTNGQSLVLGQIALADFSNVQGLKPTGDSAWIQSNASGEPVIGTPTSGSLGVITAGALEDSNVELSEQLVNLIVAQRNFQANARTISTADEITQTIIQL